MAKEINWAEERFVNMQKQHSLENYCPPLKSYLKPGLKVLDAGCGPGHVTVGVANHVHPGSVVGVDLEAKMIEEAKALAEKTKTSNAVFQPGDAHALEFADGTFDLTYTTGVLHLIREPVKVLKEQRRVTKRGGWVAAMIGAWDTLIMHPPCPAYRKFIASLKHLKDPANEDFYVNFFLGREAVALFSQAGFEETKIEGFICPLTFAYSGSENFDSQYNFIKGYLTPNEQVGALKKLIELGKLDEETLAAAREEIEAWHRHPHAISLYAHVLAAGKVG